MMLAARLGKARRSVPMARSVGTWSEKEGPVGADLAEQARDHRALAEEPPGEIDGVAQKHVELAIQTLSRL